MINEIKVLSDLDHPNIINIYEYFEDANKIYIIIELIEGGQLFDEIIARGCFNERDAAICIQVLLSCISYCHANNIMHRDLKPENMLLEKNKKFDQIKVIDFGTAKRFKNWEVHSEFVGTPYYVAPGILKRNYGKECDIWSCGVITYLLLSGSPPFDGDDNSEIEVKI